MIAGARKSAASNKQKANSTLALRSVGSRLPQTGQISADGSRLQQQLEHSDIIFSRNG